ncbi:MAG: carboxypeptidase-like regulatory domain-containing protein [Trueperaceae bacterium]|nr:carboxypeptidase-like regulatory domain-containing protein [Trueperaceae bacterium]
MDVARGRWRVDGCVAVGLLAVVLVGCPSTVDPPAATITVEGLVLASEGTPLAGVLVHAQGELTTTEADGSFRLEGIEPPYTLTLGSRGTTPGSTSTRG